MFCITVVLLRKLLLYCVVSLCVLCISPSPTMPWIDLQSMIGAFGGHGHLLFFISGGNLLKSCRNDQFHIFIVRLV